MGRDIRSGASKPPNWSSVPDRSGAEVPPVGAVEADKIKAVELDPRSNGENDWQDEMPVKKPRPR